VLLVGSGLLLASLRNVLRVDPGFDSESVLTGFIALSDVRYNDYENPDAAWDDELRLIFTDELLEKVRVLPGVGAASVTTQMPFLSNLFTTVIMPEGYELDTEESIRAPRRGTISPGYFETMRIPILEGRDFEETDTAASTPVMIVDERVARHFWPNSSPIGKRVYLGVLEEEVEEKNFLTVVGVAGEVKNSDLEVDEIGEFYVPYSQFSPNFLVLVVRAEVEPTSLIKPLGEIVADIDPELPFFLPWELDDRIALSLRDRSTPTVLLILSGTLALFLAAIGLYGMLAYSVSQRTREIGIRMAMGSTVGQLFQLIVYNGLKLLVIGLSIGLIVILTLSGLIRSHLFGVGPADPLIFAIVITTMAVMAILACLVPAHRATLVDPVEALNYE
jgi:predicted permease